MEKREESAILMDKLTQLNELEMKKSTVLAVIFQKTTQEIKEKKMQDLKKSFEEQIKYYDQYLEDYEEDYQQISTQYEQQLTKILEEYKMLYINLYLELQEAECNQKIAITNYQKSCDTKQEMVGRVHVDKIEAYDRKVKACFQKKNNYDIIINECEKTLDKCAMNMTKKINSLFSDKSSQIVVREEGLFTKIINKVKNIFQGKTKFNTYVLEPWKVELEMMENKLPDVINDIQQEAILFVAKMKQAKAQTNQIFEQMI